MKWYERQKQLYAQRNQSMASKSDPVEETKEAIEETHYENNYQQDNNDMYMEDQYENMKEEQNFPPYEEEVDYDTTILNKGSVLTGNIECDNDLIIHGHVKGDVICNANLSVYGVIEGSIHCGNAYFDNAIIVGDIGCSGSLQISESSTVDGNVEAYELMNGGRIKGNAVVSDGVRFLSTSVIVGDIDANDIEIERGAVIQGSVTIRQEVYFEK